LLGAKVALGVSLATGLVGFAGIGSGVTTGEGRDGEMMLAQMGLASETCRSIGPEEEISAIRANPCNPNTRVRFVSFDGRGLNMMQKLTKPFLLDAKSLAVLWVKVLPC
jgi:hypothetical protein